MKNDSKNILKILIIALLISLYALFLSSCSSRKTAIEKVTKQRDSIAIDKTTVLKEDYIFNDIFTLKPFDNSKPMLIHGKEYVNVVISNDKSKIYKKEFTVYDKKTITKTIEVTKTKNIERKTVVQWWYLLLLIPLGLLVWIWKNKTRFI